MGLVVKKRPNIPTPERVINTIHIQGRNGELTEDQGTYRDITISIEFFFKDYNNFNKKCRCIKAWLLNVTDKTLFFSDDNDIFYIVKSVNFADIERSMKTMGRFNVDFICAPFEYLRDDNINIDTPTNIYNPGTFYSEPQLKIYGTGDITLRINDKNIILKGISNYIILETEIQEAYIEGASQNNKMTGEFPIFEVGDNNISWTGNISKIEIIPRWRFL